MKKILLFASLIFATFFLSGCSLGTGLGQTTANPMTKATVIKTADGGTAWEAKIKMDDKKDISSINVLSVAVDPFDENTIYLGSEKNGIFVSHDGAETWEQMNFPEKVYGLALDHSIPDVIYASGVFKDRAKIFKKIGKGSEWKEIYTEPSDGTIISSLAIDKFNANILYAGTSQGVIFKTTDGGSTWNNLYKADAPVTSIAFDSSNSTIVYFGVFQRGLLRTSNGGSQVENITHILSGLGGNQNVFSVVADPRVSGTVYVGLSNGISKSVDGGATWTEINVLGSSKNFPARVIAVNPQNSKEIVYVAGKAIYKSVDGGSQWATFQLDAPKDISGIVYNKNNPSIIYAGLRNF